MNLRSGHEGYDDESVAGAPPAVAGPSRRAVLRGVAVAGALGLGGAVLAGCGSDGEDASNTTGPANGNGSTADGGDGEGGGGGGAGALASTADIPEGGGTIFADEKVVVTQPTPGEFLGFSAVCTHQACTLATVEGGTINCSCHGSRFSIEDGSVQNGPATRPLPKVNVKVEGDQIVRG